MSVSIAEAKSRFSALVDRAAAGEETTITRHGKPVARIVPIGQSDEGRERARRAFRELLDLRDKSDLTLADLDWKELRDVGRK